MPHDESVSRPFPAGIGEIVRLSKEAIVTCKLDGSIIGWNPCAERMCGYTPEEILGQSLLKLFIPGEAEDQFAFVVERIRQGEVFEDLEARWLRKDGRSVDVSLSFIPVRNERHVTVGMICMGRDLSVRNRLRLAERDQLFLDAVTFSADEAIINVDLKGVVTTWNPAAEAIFGYGAGEMIGQPMSALIPASRPDEERQLLEQIQHGASVERYETQRVRKDGTIIDVLLTQSAVRDRVGRLVGGSRILRDITDRKRWQRAEAAQSFLGALVESAEDAIISKDLNGVVISWNAGAEAVFGYSASEMIGKPVSILIPQDHPNEEPQILQRIRRGDKMAHYETKRVRKDGSVIDVSLTVSPIKDQLGQVIGASKIARDITQNKRAEAREREILHQVQQARRQAEIARQQAEQASTAKDEFLATISHELRTPITAILGWTRMLVMGQLTPERQEKAFEIIDRNARTQAQLIEDLLDVSRIISGKMSAEFKAVDMASVITAAIDAVRPAAEAKHIRVTFTGSSDAGPFVGDAQRLQQLTWNLLSNAIKFTPQGGAVQVILRRVESQLELRVSDNGIGISKEFLPSVFNRFSQADSSITRSHGGLGMGLAIVKALAELHGGVVEALSEGEGKGTEFVARLPIRAMHEGVTSRPDPQPRMKPEIKRREDLAGIRLLIVDDDTDTCDMLRYVFHQCGAVVEVAQSADAALKLFDMWLPDMIISDIGMPDVDGYELIRILRNERKSHIPAVALTAMARIEDRVKALSAGYQMHVAKPVEPTELITTVAGLVGLINRPPD